MANNRMFLKCTKCGAVMTLGKYFPTGQWDFRVTDVEWEGFLNEHAHDAPLMEGSTHFTLDYETKPVEGEND